MGDLEPITRNEKLWSGEDLTPVTRREMYIKHLYDETQVIPEYPVTREEMFILKAGEELHDVTIEQLTATENRTYSEEGVAYSPVIVNVPLPENAYLLKEIEDVEIASFNDGSDLPMAKLEVAIEPVQDLHGYDAPWVGGAGKNKFDATTLMANVNSSVQYVTITLKPNTTYTMSTSLGKIDNVCNLFFMLPNESASSATNGVYSGLSISVTSGNDGQVKVGYRLPSDGTTSAQYLAKQYQIEEGSTATSYEPYSNICPISGWDEVNVSVVGKNWFKLNSSSTSSDVISSIDTSTGKVGIADISSIKWASPYFAYSAVVGCQTYTLSVDTMLKYGRVGGSLSDTTQPLSSNIPDTNIGSTIQSAVNNAYSSRTFTANKTQRIYWYYCTDANNSNRQAFDFYPQLELENESSAMTPYNGQTYTIDLDGTRYGGKVDLVSGVMTVEWLKDVHTWGDYSAETILGDYARRRLTINTNIKDDTAMCSVAPWNKVYSLDTNHFYVQNGDTNSAIWMYLPKNTSSDFSIEVCYELATPLTIQLTPTVVKSLKGKNNVFADTGNILDLSYLAKEE